MNQRQQEVCPNQYQDRSHNVIEVIIKECSYDSIKAEFEQGLIDGRNTDDQKKDCYMRSYFFIKHSG